VRGLHQLRSIGHLVAITTTPSLERLDVVVLGRDLVRYGPDLSLRSE
jgi:hypothetical protein